MKKILSALLCALTLTGVSFAQDIGKVSNFSNSVAKEFTQKLDDNFAYYFGGFDFKNYKLGDPDLTAITNAEYEAIKGGLHGVSKAPASYTVIGHSQGGLRALAYATTLKKNDPDNFKKLNAVITISGIDKGLKALDGGLGTLSNNLKSKINIFGNGLRATFGVLDYFGVLNKITPRNALADQAMIFIDFFPGELKLYLKEAFKDPNSPDLAQIHDMAPRSNYIKTNVADITPRSYGVQTGSKVVLEWRYTRGPLGIKIWYLWIGSVPVYSYYTAYEDTPKFEMSLPVGFIVGTNSNTLSLAEGNESKIRDTLNGFGAAFVVAESWHILKSVCIIGLFTGSVTYAKDASRAYKLMHNFDSEINDIKGSSANDGLVAVESQYYPATFYHPGNKTTSTVLKNPLGVVYKQYNHEIIAKREDTFAEVRNMLRKINK
jgi:pimeloyl-ACP methyl ester carboxylesterase